MMNKFFFIFSQRSYMETKGWDVFRSLPPETDSSSEAVDKWLGTTVKILKVGKKIKRGRFYNVNSGPRLYPHILRGAHLWCRHKGHHTLHDQSDQTRQVLINISLVKSNPKFVSRTYFDV